MFDRPTIEDYKSALEEVLVKAKYFDERIFAGFLDTVQIFGCKGDRPSFGVGKVGSDYRFFMREDETSEGFSSVEEVASWLYSHTWKERSYGSWPRGYTWMPPEDLVGEFQDAVFPPYVEPE